MASILVVDDDADSRDALSHYLRSKGFSVTCAPDGRQALRHILNHMPDVVILDLYMPEMDGVHFLSVIRSYLRLQSLPVLIWTGVPNGDLVAEVRNLAVSGILAKPSVQFEDIHRAVTLCLPESKQRTSDGGN